MSLLQHVVESYAANGEPLKDSEGTLLGYATVRYADETVFDMSAVVADVTIRYPATVTLAQGQVVSIFGSSWVVAEQPRKIGTGLRYQAALQREDD